MTGSVVVIHALIGALPSLYSGGIPGQARQHGQNDEQRCHHADACQCGQRETVPEQESTKGYYAGQQNNDKS